MGSLMDFVNHLDWQGLLLFLMGAACCLVCVTVHELSHGLAAAKLGDPTARINGRLTVNPIAHIDPVGLLLLLTVGVGWAKPVPVNLRNFAHPKRDMALTALAGPASNFILAYVSLLIGSAVYHLSGEMTLPIFYVLLFLGYLAVLSTGLGVFNLIPIPPLDGSRLVFAALPDRTYHQYLRYERFLILAIVVLMWSGVFSGPIQWCVSGVDRVLAALSGYPRGMLEYYFF